MNRKTLLIAAVSIALAGCQDNGSQPGENASSATTEVRDLASLAAAAASGVATVGEVRTDGEGSPVFVFPEDHALVDGQAQEAVSLYRINKATPLAAIVLEGWRNDVAIADVPRGDPLILANILREGDLSSAEFMATAFGTKLIPGETPTSYSPNPEQVDVCGALLRVSVIDIGANGPLENATVDDIESRLQVYRERQLTPGRLPNR